MEPVTPIEDPFRYHAACQAPGCTFNFGTNDYEMRGVMVGQHRTRTGHSVKLTEEGQTTEDD